VTDATVPTETTQARGLVPGDPARRSSGGPRSSRHCWPLACRAATTPWPPGCHLPEDARHLSVVNTGGYLALLISGAFLGYVTGGYVTDLLGRKRTFALFAVLSAALIVAYTNIPAGANTVVLLLGFPLGFASSAIYSGFGSFLAELYPTALRAPGRASPTTSAEPSARSSPPWSGSCQRHRHRAAMGKNAPNGSAEVVGEALPGAAQRGRIQLGQKRAEPAVDGR